MDYIEGIIEKVADWIRQLIDALMGESPEAEPELIPIPVRDRQSR
jgi:hypothetical protein